MHEEVDKHPEKEEGGAHVHFLQAKVEVHIQLVECGLQLSSQSTAVMSLGWKQFLLSRVLIAISVLMALFIGLIRRPFLLFRRTKRRTSPPDCMLDPTLGKHQYVQANGIKFHYVTCGDPSKPLMLFLHGFPEVST